MNTAIKLLAAMRQNPNDWTMAQLLDEAGYTGDLTRIGITRAYATRHGAGPLVTEDAALTHALPDASNSFGAWQRGFRVGKTKNCCYL